MGRLWALLLPVIFYVIAGGTQGVLAQKNGNTSPNPKGEKLTLVEASVCEKMKGSSPVNRAIVFSSGLERIYCFTAFDPVPREMVIYHEWYRRDRLKAKMKLTLKPPRWSTFTSIRIRKSDRGPWRINVTDPAGRILTIVRFSVTE